MIECIPPPRPTSASSSTRSSRRTGVLVDEVLALAAAVQPPRDRDLRPFERAVTGRVVEEQLDLAVLGALARASEPAKRTSSGFSARSSCGASEPAAQTIASATFDFPEPFGPDHDGDARLEPDLDGLRKRLEAAQLDRTEVHALRRLARRADGGAPIRGEHARGLRGPRLRRLDEPERGERLLRGLLLGRLLRRAAARRRAARRRSARRT